MGIVPVYHFMLRGDDRVGAPAPYFGIRTVNTSFRIAEDLVIRRVQARERVNTRVRQI